MLAKWTTLLRLKVSSIVKPHLCDICRDSEVPDKRKFQIFEVYSYEIKIEEIFLTKHVYKYRFCTHKKDASSGMRETSDFTLKRQNLHAVSWGGVGGVVCAGVAEVVTAHLGMGVYGA